MVGDVRSAHSVVSKMVAKCSATHFTSATALIFEAKYLFGDAVGGDGKQLLAHTLFLNKD